MSTKSIMGSDSKNLSDYVAELKDRLDIHAVIHRYVTLKKSGSRYVGLCPFHNDRSPSMNVTPQMGIYKCFVCGAGGDVIKFVQEYEKITFWEALKQLSQEAGMVLPEGFQNTRSENGDKKSRTLELNGLAGEAFQKKLAKTESIQSYLRNRGISPEIQKKFQLGLSPDNWDGFLKYAKGKGYSEKELLEGGLIKAKDRGGFRDLFVGRLMFPIWNLSHRIVAFGGRTLEKDGIPKYLNSPETPAYHKSRVLYGLNFARNQVQATGELILVEGYMDVLALHQAGIENVAAVSGTSLTVQHGESIARLAQKVLFFLDGDNAGRQAIERSLPILLRLGIEVRIPELPKGEDPDSYALEHGKEGVEELLSNSANVVEYLTRNFRASSSSFSPEEKERLLKSCEEVLKSIPSEWVRDEYQKQLNQVFGISKGNEQQTSVRKLSSFSNERTLPELETQGLPLGDRLIQRVAYKVKKEPEWRLTQLLISSEELCGEALKCIRLEWFADPFVQDLVDRLLAYYEQEGKLSLSRLLEFLPDSPRLAVESMEVLELVDLEALKTEFYDTVNVIKTRSIQKAMKVLETQIKDGIIDRAEAVKQHMALKKQLREQLRNG